MRYFETDGIRGKFGEDINCELCYRVGLAAAKVCGGVVCVGRDTRRSGEVLTDALVSGLIRGGCKVRLLGILPTPAVAYETVESGANLGIMVSASHNPPEYNGVKMFDGAGYKLRRETEEKIEYYIDNPPAGLASAGSVTREHNAVDCYVNSRIKAYKGALGGVRVCLDCAFGASYDVAERIFEGCGARVKAYNNRPLGERINDGCGALYPEFVRKKCLNENTALGFAFDGDADRLSVVESGEVLDGDSVLYNLYKAESPGGVLVGTVLSNTALERKVEECGGKLLRTDVGDKYIGEKMRENGYAIGGEQSGHYIIAPSTTGDGVMSALVLTSYLCRGGSLQSPERLTLTPQKSVSMPAPRSIIESDGIKKLTAKFTKALAPYGRILVRYSGTEPKVRVMAESEDAAAVEEALNAFSEYVKNYK